jgi:hypothetical protein
MKNVMQKQLRKVSLQKSICLALATGKAIALGNWHWHGESRTRVEEKLGEVSSTFLLVKSALNMRIHDSYHTICNVM